MTAVIKEEKTMATSVKTYLELYQEFIVGYKQYKMEKAAPTTRVGKARHAVN